MIQFKEIKEIIYKNDKGELMFSNMNNKEPLSKETVEAINQQIREGKIIEIGFFKGTLKRRDDI